MKYTSEIILGQGIITSCALVLLLFVPSEYGKYIALGDVVSITMYSIIMIVIGIKNKKISWK